jgi:hypothetical protein
MSEKYGIGAKLPEDEVKAREAARAQEDKTHRHMIEDQLGELYPRIGNRQAATTLSFAGRSMFADKCAFAD